MKTLTLFILILFCNFSIGQSKKDIIANSNYRYNLINELIDNNILRQYHTTYNYQETTNNGTITYYYNSGELKSIIYTYIKNRMFFRNEFYVWNNSLMYAQNTRKIRYQDFDYTAKEENKPLQCVTTTIKEKYYFDNNQIVHCESSKTNTTSDKIEITEDTTATNPKVCSENFEVMEKFNVFLSFSKTQIKKPETLPKSITKFAPIDIIYNQITTQ